VFEKIHQSLDDPNDVVGWSLSLGFFIGLLSASWYDVLVGLNYDAFTLTITTVGIAVLGVYFLNKTIERQDSEVTAGD
jgi:hypothetical protein